MKCQIKDLINLSHRSVSAFDNFIDMLCFSVMKLRKQEKKTEISCTTI